MAYNTILIKRRLTGATGAPTLSGGELGYNEVDNTLYYGASGGGAGNSIAIGGRGAYVNLTSSQTISGNKTFTGSTTLSSTTFSSNSVLNAGGNTITNVGYPVLSSDAATKQYVVDTYIPIAASGDYVNRTDAQTVSGVKTFFNDTIFNENISVGKNLTITGNLSVLGATTQLDTLVYSTSAVSITNAGTGPGLTVTQTGDQPIAVFYDDSNVPALYIDGKTATPGYVGVGIATPNEKLTVVGNISASGNVRAVNGNFSGTFGATGAATLGSSLTVTTNISGTQYSSQLVDFIIDGGTF